MSTETVKKPETAAEIVAEFAAARHINVQKTREILEVTDAHIRPVYEEVRSEWIREGRPVDDFLIWLQAEMRILNGVRAKRLRGLLRIVRVAAA